MLECQLVVVELLGNLYPHLMVIEVLGYGQDLMIPRTILVGVEVVGDIVVVGLDMGQKLDSAGIVVDRC